MEKKFKSWASERFPASPSEEQLKEEGFLDNLSGVNAWYRKKYEELRRECGIK